MHETTLRPRPLRRYRELVCTAFAVSLWLIVRFSDRGGFSGGRGHLVLITLSVLEAGSLAVLFVLEALRPRGAHGPRWITVAWASLPVWALAGVLAATVLRATS